SASDFFSSITRRKFSEAVSRPFVADFAFQVGLQLAKRRADTIDPFACFPGHRNVRSPVLMFNALDCAVGCAKRVGLHLDRRKDAIAQWVQKQDGQQPRSQNQKWKTAKRDPPPSAGTAGPPKR